MNIEQINKRHFLKRDMYYRAGQGLSSELLAVKNGVIFLKVMVREKWNKPLKETALELANLWRDHNPELSNALGCKVFIIDAKNNPFKADMLQIGMSVNYDVSLGLIFGEEQMN